VVSKKILIILKKKIVIILQKVEFNRQKLSFTWYHKNIEKNMYIAYI